MITKSTDDSKDAFPNIQGFLDSVEAYLNATEGMTDKVPQSDLVKVTGQQLRTAVDHFRGFSYPACPHCALGGYAAAWIVGKGDADWRKPDIAQNPAYTDQEGYALSMGSALLQVAAEYIGWNLRDETRATAFPNITKALGHMIEREAANKAAMVKAGAVPGNEPAPAGGSRH